MLSRAAERVYWSARYLERAENTARIVQQYSQLLLDLPDEVGVGWGELVTIFGATGAFTAEPGESDEAAVLRFLVSDARSPASLAYSIRMARDNIRNTRDLLPQEAWESVNELDHFAQKKLAATADDEDRFERLAECIERCVLVDGLLFSTMSHGPPYQFLRLGQCLERADMTSRIVDVGAAYVRQDPELTARFGSVLGTNLLKSVAGFQMYRQYCQPRVQAPAVVQFLVQDEQFPRSIAACVQRARRACGKLPGNAAVTERLDQVAALLAEDPRERLTADSVTRIMDRIQREIGAVHGEVARSWFLDAGGEQ